MTSGTSCFNRSLCGHLLRRFWPVWLSYFVLLMLSFCLQLPQLLQEALRVTYPVDLHLRVLHMALDQVVLAPFAAVLTVMALFSFLYNSRTCGMMHALPLRRETIFGTTTLTGLVPLLMAQVLAMLLGALLSLGGGIRFVWLLEWLGLSALALVAFYGFAVFCAMLTGSLWVLPAVYAALGVAVVVAENCMDGVLATLSFGGYWADPRLEALSPLLFVLDKMTLLKPPDGAIELRGLGTLAVYAVLGLVLCVCALLLYKRRQLECAGDAVAVPILKPVFRLCMGFGGAFVVTAILLSLFVLPESIAALTALTLGLLLFGAFVGFYLAEVLLQRSFKPTFTAWKLPAVFCLLLVLLVAAVRFDLGGAQRWVPEADEVTELRVCDVALSRPESIREAVALHRSVIDNRARLEGVQDGFPLNLSYTLTNGETRTRRYLLPLDGENPDEVLLLAASLLDCPEAIEDRVRTDIPVERDRVEHAQLEIRMDEQNYSAINLTAEQAVALYREGVLADAAEGHMGRYELFAKGADQVIYFHLVLTREDDPRQGAIAESYASFAITPQAAHSLAWLEQNLGVTIPAGQE